jgi:hypothetical protein
MVTVISLVVLFSWVPASAQWSGHTSGQLQPASRAIPVNLMGVEAALVEMTNDIRRRNGLPVLLKDGICRDAGRGHSADIRIGGASPPRAEITGITRPPGHGGGNAGLTSREWSARMAMPY